MIDLIFTTRPTDPAAFIAADLDMTIGCVSADSRVLKTGRYDWAFKIDFIDNDFKAYDHRTHLSVVRVLRPRYATVRDLMTPEQCQRDGIEWFSFEQIMTWTAEIAEYTKNVIVIPKYDCIDEIYNFDSDMARKIILGYSVETGYGGTPVSVSRFSGRPVHLLGGRFDKQMEKLNQLNGDVVSIDFNQINLIAKHGDYITPDGRRHTLANNRLGFVQRNRVACLALSLNAIKARLTLKKQPQPELLPLDLIA